MGLREEVLRGLGWSGAAHVLKQSLVFVVGVVLARLLGPREFGLVAMVWVFTGLADLLRTLGLGSAIVQRPRPEPALLDSVFWVNAATGAALAAAGLAASGPVGRFYGEPEVAGLMALLSANFAVASLNTVQQALLARDLDYARLAKVETGAVLLAGALGIGLAAGGWGARALAWQSLAGQLLTTAFLWASSPWRPSLRFDGRLLGEALRFGGWLTAHSALEYATRSLDKLLLGRFSGAAELGLYGRAQLSMTMPVQQLSATVSRVMFPALSRLQGEPARAKAAYLKALRLVAFAGFPAMLGLWAVSEPFVVGLFGPHWSGMVPLLELFCLTGLQQCAGHTTGWIFLSQGRADLLFRWQLYASAVLVSAVLLGLRGGALGVAAAYAAAAWLFLFVPGFAAAGPLIGLRLGEAAAALRGSLACAAAMAAGVRLASGLLPDPWGPWPRLAVLVPLGAALYGLLARAFRPEGWRELVELAGRRA